MKYREYSICNCDCHEVGSGEILHISSCCDLTYEKYLRNNQIDYNLLDTIVDRVNEVRILRYLTTTLGNWVVGKTPKEIFNMVSIKPFTKNKLSKIYRYLEELEDIVYRKELKELK